jgi:hypothetical protein
VLLRRLTATSARALEARETDRGERGSDRLHRSGVDAEPFQTEEDLFSTLMGRAAPRVLDETDERREIRTWSLSPPPEHP